MRHSSEMQMEWKSNLTRSRLGGEQRWRSARGAERLHQAAASARRNCLSNISLRALRRCRDVRRAFPSDSRLRGSREGANLKEKLAEHLGIGEARVGKYLKDNCVVRWLQLDEGAPLLAHFAIAVLRPVANE